MKPKTLILLMVAIGCGLVAAFLASQATGKGKVDTVKVLVTKKEGGIRQGQYITAPEEFFELADRPVGMVGQTPITDLNEVKNKSMQRTLDQGVVVSKKDVADPEGLVKTLKVGERAMTLPVTPDSAVSGFILPGYRVDLLCKTPDPKDPRQSRSRIFLQDKLVLAVNTSDSKPENERVVQQPIRVTLALLPEEVERVNQAVALGIPTMVLRRPDDNKSVRTSGAVSPFREGGAEETADTKNVLVAKIAIDGGTIIDNVDKFFETAPWPAGQVPPGAISDPSKIRPGQKVEKFLGAKMPLTGDYLVAVAVKEGKDPPDRVEPPKTFYMKIYQGATKQVVPFGPGDETIPSGTPIGPRSRPESPGGSEGK
jgi:Flp pilus assembly protein CpaB